MKSALLAATAVGAALAGLILYYQKRLTTERKMLATENDDFHSMSNGNGIGKMERPAVHAMG